jgi:O-acetylserine/cysteine efflux transporter
MKMPVHHNLLALLIATIWGLTFVSIKSALQTVPPFALSFWRFLLAAIPLVFFVGAPQAPWRWLFGYGIAIAIGQFVVLFIAMKLGMPAGLMSLVVQTQVFFTIGLSVVLFGETVQRAQLIGAIIASLGLIVIGMDKLKDGIGLAFALVLFAAFAWGVGNVIAKHVARVAKARGQAPISPMNFIAWTSVAAVPPLATISWLTEAPGALWVPTAQVSWTLTFHLCVLAYFAQVFGYGLWAHLLTRYPASSVSPFALWVPVAGMSATAYFFGESLTSTQLFGALIVISGLAVAVLWPAKPR